MSMTWHSVQGVPMPVVQRVQVYILDGWAGWQSSIFCCLWTDLWWTGLLIRDLQNYLSFLHQLSLAIPWKIQFLCSQLKAQEHRWVLLHTSEQTAWLFGATLSSLWKMSSNCITVVMPAIWFKQTTGASAHLPLSTWFIPIMSRIRWYEVLTFIRDKK